MKKLVMGIVVVVLLLLVINSIKSPEIENKNTSPIKVGMIASLTGDAAVYGEPMLKVYKIAIDEINSQGGIDGRNLELVAEDGKCSGASSASAASKLVNVDKVQVILGGFCSSESLAAIPSVETGKVAIISGGSSSPDLTGKSKFFSRTFPSDSTQGSVIAKLAIDSGIKNVYAIYEQLDYPLGIYKSFEKTFVELGGTVNKEEFPTATSDFKSIIAKAKSASPDALFLIPQTPAVAEKIAQQLRDSGWKPKVLASDIILLTPELVSKYSVFEGAMGATFEVDESNPKLQKLEATYKEKYGKDVPYSGYAQTVYDSVYLVADALRAVGNDGEKITNWLHHVSGWSGASGLITIGADGDRIGGHQARIVKDGKVTLYTK